MTDENKVWITKMRNIAILLMVGFAAGSIVSNITFTYHLQKDCETMKQFRVGQTAYMCMGK